MKRLCVFAGSSSGADPRYAEAARRLGELLAARGVGVVYGGASIGLMGALADAALAGGGEVIGVMPRALVEKEIAHPRLSDLRVVDDMHARKAMMASLADGFVALPGGAGTLEELFEVWTWAQLGFHAKPCGLLDAGGYYSALTVFLDHMVREGFIHPTHRAMLTISDDPRQLLDRFAAYVPPPAKFDADRSVGAEHRQPPARGETA